MTGSLLAVLPHPDDESFGMGGLLYRYARLGVTTTLVCLTRGEVGRIADPSLATPDTLGEVREGELREAARILGVRDVIFLGYRDGTLEQVDGEEAVGRLVRIIREIRPEVLVTFGEMGGYGHPDHITGYRWTREAFHAAGDPARYPQQIAEGLAPFSPRKLYALAFRWRYTRLPELPYADEEVEIPDEAVSVAAELTDEEYRAKLRALGAHRSQAFVAEPYLSAPEEEQRALLAIERFARLEPPWEAGTPREPDLFD